MKTLLSMLILVLVFALVGFMESPVNTKEINGSNFKSSLDNDTEVVTTHEEEVSSYTELEMVFKGKKQVDGQIVETYREYEIYRDEEGNIVREVPTSNYDYISYSP